MRVGYNSRFRGSRTPLLFTAIERTRAILRSRAHGSVKTTRAGTAQGSLPAGSCDEIHSIRRTRASARRCTTALALCFALVRRDAACRCRRPRRAMTRAHPHQRVRHRGADPDRREPPLRRLPGHLALHEPARHPAHRVRGAVRHGGAPRSRCTRSASTSASAIASTSSIRSSSSALMSIEPHGVPLVQGVVALRARRRAGHAGDHHGRGRRGRGPGEGALAQPRVARRGLPRRRREEARPPAARRARAGRRSTTCRASRSA